MPCKIIYLFYLFINLLTNKPVNHTWDCSRHGEEIRPGLKASVSVSGGGVGAGLGRGYDRILERDGVVDERGAFWQRRLGQQR